MSSTCRILNMIQNLDRENQLGSQLATLRKQHNCGGSGASAWEQVRWIRLDRRNNRGSDLKFYVLYPTRNGSPLPHGVTAHDPMARESNNPTNTKMITIPTDEHQNTWIERAYDPKNTNTEPWQWQSVDTIMVKLDETSKAGTFVSLLNPNRVTIWEYEFKANDPLEMTFTFK